MHSDPVASDVRYHRDCRGYFDMDKYDKKCSEVDDFFLKVAEKMTNEPTIWNSLDLHQMQVDYGGDSFDRKRLINSLLEHFKGYTSKAVF